MNISSMSIITQVTTGLNRSQASIADLSQQLASGVKSSDLTSFSSFESRTLINSRNLQEKADSYIAAMGSVRPRLMLYENSLSSVESLVKTMQTLILNTQTPQAAREQGVPSQISGIIDQVSFYLNQKLGDRYIFSGTRYTDLPVRDIKTIANPPTEAFPAASPDLPPYDPQAPGTDAEAYGRDAVAIDDNLRLTYGIPSTSRAIQDLMQALRFTYAATQDDANYQNYMAEAQPLLKEALDGIRALRGEVAGNVKIVDETIKGQKTTIDLLKTRIGDIRNADLNEVSVKINAYNAQLQASYAASARLINLTILDYL
jgi:flagellar hook-associated protein 3 FlgL